jgi:hypothetical protein
MARSAKSWLSALVPENMRKIEFFPADRLETEIPSGLASSAVPLAHSKRPAFSRALRAFDPEIGLLDHGPFS